MSGTATRKLDDDANSGGRKQDTRTALILAAERLIAQRGIDGVSLRQINTEAGQRNSSAAHYHFGSKDALIRSIYEYRLSSVNERRQAMLDEMRASGLADEPRHIVAAIVLPIVEEIEQSDGGSFYIQFLSQAIGHPQGSARKYFDATLTGAASEIYDLIASTVPEIGPRILGERFGLMWEMVIHSLADRERYLHDAQSGIGAGDAFINNLIDMVTGGLTAPVSPETSATT